MHRSPLLNPDQARHLAATLAVLLDDLETLRPALAAEPWGGAAIALIGEIEARVSALLAAVGIGGLAPRPAVAQRLAAVRGVWRARLPELGAGALRAYGAVRPEAAAALAPGLAALAERLDRLAGVGGGATR